MKISNLSLIIGTMLIIGCDSKRSYTPTQDKTEPAKQEAERYQRNTETTLGSGSESIPQESQSIDGVYSHSGGDSKGEVIIMGDTWTGSFTFVTGFGDEYDSGNTEYQSGIVRGKDLYDESGFVKIGYVQGRSLTTTVGGQYLTLRKR